MKIEKLKYDDKLKGNDIDKIYLNLLEVGEKVNELIDRENGRGERQDICGIALEQLYVGQLISSHQICQNPKGSCPVHDKTRECMKCKKPLRHWMICKECHGNSPQPASVVEGWHAGFHKLWVKTQKYAFDVMTMDEMRNNEIDIESFISKLLVQARAEEREKMRNKILSLQVEKCTSCRAMLELLRELK